MKTLIPLFVCLLALSCEPCRYVARHQECFPPDTIINTEIRTVHDSVTWILGDTSLFDALFECDSLNQVIMRDLSEYKSKGIQTKVIFRDNRLQLATFTDSIAVLNKIISNQRSHVEYVKNPLNTELQRKNIVLTDRLHNRRWLLWYFIGTIIALAAYIYLRILK